MMLLSTEPCGAAYKSVSTDYCSDDGWSVRPTYLGVKTGDVLVVGGDVQAQLVGAAGEVQVAHVADVGRVEVQQFVAEQRLVATQLHLTHLRVRHHTLS